MRLSSQAFFMILCLAGLAWGERAVSLQIHQEWLKEQNYGPPPAGMVLVPTGEFWMGSDSPQAEPDERPLRRVFLPAFYMDIHEVTNREYKTFKKDHQYPAGEDNFPVTFIHKNEAEAYARSLSKRLPTNAEWEKAARGTDGRTYPWGNEFKPGFANINPDGFNKRGAWCVLPGRAPNARGKLPPGSFPKGASPYGCQDMAGNVWEWVSDVYRVHSLFVDDRDGQGIIRGGAFAYSPLQARTSYQGFEGVTTTCHDVGFRCAMDAVPK